MSTTWRIKDRLVEPHFPVVMGILNATPDSFHASSRVGIDNALATAERMLDQGAFILDIGGASSRPGAKEITPDEERRRALPLVEAIHQRFPDALLSIDTWHAGVADDAVAAGAGMVNDIGAGLLDPDMLPTVARLAVPYVIMHMQGRPTTMQEDPRYADVLAEVTFFLSERITSARAAGIADVIIDPGFGFGKTTAHNYALLRGVPRLCALGAPLLAGVSRKRMVNEILGTKADAALNGTTVLNTIALMHGASILRVHDVKEAREAIGLVAALRAS